MTAKMSKSEPLIFLLVCQLFTIVIFLLQRLLFIIIFTFLYVNMAAVFIFIVSRVQLRISWGKNPFTLTSLFKNYI